MDVGYGSTEDVITAKIVPSCQGLLIQQALPEELFGPSSGSTEGGSGRISLDTQLTTQLGRETSGQAISKKDQAGRSSYKQEREGSLPKPPNPNLVAHRWFLGADAKPEPKSMEKVCHLTYRSLNYRHSEDKTKERNFQRQNRNAVSKEL